MPLSNLFVLALGTAALIALHSYPLTHQPYADWAAASAEARQALGLGIVWAGACSAWVASLHSAADSITCPTTAQRNGGRLVRTQASALITAGLIGQVIGLAPLYLWCALKSTYQADLRPLVILGGATVLVAGIAVGYLCGTALPRLLAAPAAAGIIFATVVAMGVDGEPWSTVWPFDVVAGISETSGVGLFRVAFFLTAAALCLVGSARWLGSRRASPLSVTTLAVTLAPVLLLAQLTSARHPALIHRDVVNSRCDQSGTVRVCLHPSAANLLPSLVEGLGVLKSTLGPDVAFPADVTDGTGPEGKTGFVIDVQPNSTWRAWAILSVANDVLETRVCWSSVSRGVTAADVSGGAALWFASVAEPRALELYDSGPTGEVARRLTRVPADKMGARLREALPDLRACRATLTQLLP